MIYRQERIKDVKAEIEAILSEQWQFENEELPPAPNWTLYERLDSLGGLVLLVARTEKGCFTGYIGAIVHRHVHAEALTASISTYFVRKNSNRALILRRLFAKTIGLLQARKVIRINAMTSLEPGSLSCERLFSAMGFRPHSVTYRMKVEAPHA